MRPQVLTIMVFTRFLETTTVFLRSLEVFSFFPPRNKGLPFVPNGSFEHLLGMKLGKFLFDIAFLLAF